MSILQNILAKKEPSSFFLTLGVEEHHIFAAAAKIIGNKITVVGTGESEFREKENEIEAADIAISTAEKIVDENILIDKVVFGIPMAFIEQDKIKPGFLERLKNISHALELKPSGFIEYPQAIAYYLQIKEEAPATVILLAIGQSYLTFSLLRVGRMEFSTTIERGSNFLVDFEKILDGISSEVLPSKIIIYDENRNSQLEQLREELLTFRWQKHPSFLHTPKIEIMPKNFIVTALVEAAAGSLIKEWLIEEKPHYAQTPIVQSSPKIQNKSVINIIEEADKEEVFGFTVGETSFREDTQEVAGKPQIFTEDKIVVKTAEKVKDEVVITNKAKNIFPRFPKFSLSFFSSLTPNLKPFIGIVILLLLACPLFYSIYQSYPSATVKLIVYPLRKSAQADFTITTDSTRLSPGKNIILASQISQEISSEKTSTVSGKTKVGEAAKGEVTIYNKTTQAKNLPKGTILESGNIKYQLAEEVKIASASDTGEGLAFGKVNGKIQASLIGPEGNMAANNIFTFQDVPQSILYGKNFENLSGGTSREISSVSKEDQNRLLSDLSGDLKSNAKQKINQQLPPGARLLDEVLQESIISKKFNKEVGDEAREFTLALAAKITGLTVRHEDLSSLTKEILSVNQSGFIQDQSRSQVTLKEAKLEKNGDIKANIVLSAYFLPEIDNNVILSGIKGKSYQQAADYLSTISNIAGVEIIRENSLPFIQNRLPINKTNIKLQLTAR